MVQIAVWNRGLKYCKIQNILKYLNNAYWTYNLKTQLYYKMQPFALGHLDTCYHKFNSDDREISTVTDVDSDVRVQVLKKQSNSAFM